MDLSKSIRRGLADINKSRTWLANELSVTPQYVAQLCNGEKEPNLNRIKSMSKLFGVPVSEFIKWGE